MAQLGFHYVNNEICSRISSLHMRLSGHLVLQQTPHQLLGEVRLWGKTTPPLSFYPVPLRKAGCVVHPSCGLYCPRWLGSCLWVRRTGPKMVLLWGPAWVLAGLSLPPQCLVLSYPSYIWQKAQQNQVFKSLLEMGPGWKGC